MSVEQGTGHLSCNGDSNSASGTWHTAHVAPGKHNVVCHLSTAAFLFLLKIVGE